MTGDLIKLTEGMEVPADILILESHEITADESAMTGESEMIKKNNFSKIMELKKKISRQETQPSAVHNELPSLILLSGTKV